MPTLPTFTVTQAQADQIIAVFTPPGGTQADAVQAFKNWYKQTVISEVLSRKGAAIDAASFQSRHDQTEVLKNQLPDPSTPAT